MALILKDRVKQQTTTTGSTDAYVLSGSFDGFDAFTEIGDGNTTYYCCTDGTDFEVGRGTFTASGTTLSRAEILSSSNSDAAVNWTSGTRTIFCTQPADKAVFLDDSGDIQPPAGTSLKLTSTAGTPVINITGGGPNTIRFHDTAGFGSSASAVDLVYRTSPDDLLIERAENANKMAEFGGNDGHVKLFYNGTDRLETTSTGTTLTGDLLVGNNAANYGQIEVFGSTGAFIDLKSPSSDDYDLRLITNGTTSQILSDDLHIQSVTGEENYIDATLNGAVNLYYDNNLRLNTTTDGVTVTGGTGPCNFVILADTDNSDEDDVAKLTLRQDGNNVTGTLGFGGAGVDNPLRLTNEYTGGGSGGGIEIKTGSDLSARFLSNAGAELYYDNVKTFETAADGVTVKATGENSARLTLQSDDASPADWDYEGIIDFTADDDGGTPVNYARISGRVQDVSAGTVDSYLYFHTMENDNLAETMFLTSNGQLGLNHDTPKLTFWKPGGTTYAIHLQPPTTLRDNRTQRLPDGSGTLMLNRGDGELNNTVENFQQDFSSGSYFTTGEYIEIASISPTGSSRNYSISGKIMAQASNNTQILDINVGIRFNSTGNFGYNILYNSSQMNTDWVEPVLWVNTTTDNIKLVIQAKTSSIHNLGVDLTLIQRGGYNDTTWNTTEVQTDTTTVPTGYTEYIGEKAVGSVANGAVELYHNNAKKLETTSAGATVTGNIAVTGTVDGRDVATDGTKLDGIEASADVTDATNVNAAGAAIFSTTPTANITDGSDGQVLTTDGSGGLSFTTVATGSFLPLSGGTLTDSLIIRRANSGGASLTVQADTTSTPTASLLLMRGTNDTYGSDAYVDYQILNGYGSSGSDGGTLSIARKVDGNAQTYLVDFDEDTNLLTDVRFQKAIVEKAYNCTGTVLDPSNGTLQYKTLSANTTFTESFVDGESITLMINDGSSYTVTWPTMTWSSGAAPTLATTGYTTVVLWHRGSLYGAVVN